MDYHCISAMLSSALVSFNGYDGHSSLHVNSVLTPQRCRPTCMRSHCQVAAIIQLYCPAFSNSRYTNSYTHSLQLAGGVQDAAGGQSAGRQLCSERRRLLCWLKPLLYGIHTAVAAAADAGNNHWHAIETSLQWSAAVPCARASIPVLV